MSGFSERGPVVKRRAWEGTRVKARVAWSERGWQVEIASIYYAQVGDKQWRRTARGVYLPFRTKTKWISQQLVNTLNAFFKAWEIHLLDGNGGSF
jgi:hypothetical protein